MPGPARAHGVAAVVWDDWGGFEDGVQPPTVEHWHDGTRFRYGPRVPLLVVSPWARRGACAHVASHTSILRTVEELFDLEPLTDRDASAPPLWAWLEFSRSPLPPPFLPRRRLNDLDQAAIWALDRLATLFDG